MQKMIRLAGVTFEGGQKNIKELNCPEGTLLTGTREPDNKFDPNAIRITYEGKYLGYIPKGFAKEIAPQIDSGAIFEFKKLDKVGGHPGAESRGLSVLVTNE